MIAGYQRDCRARRGAEEGAVAVEFAIIVSVLMLLLLGIFEFGVAFYRWNTMLLAVQQAGRYVMIQYGNSDTNTSCDTACAKQQLADILTDASSSCGDPDNPLGGQMCVDATCPSGCSTGNNMILSVTYGFNFITRVPFRLTASTTVPLE